MKEGRPGVYGRAKSPLVEVEAYRTDSYKAFVDKAARKCHLVPRKNKVISLFKLNGARVLDEPITVKNKVKQWTLGNYLLLMRKSPNSVKMGIGYVVDSNMSSSNSEQVRFGLYYFGFGSGSSVIIFFRKILFLHQKKQVMKTNVVNYD